MDWPPALEHHRAALLRIVAVLVLMAGLDEGGADTVPRRVWRRILRLLRPAESAVRRLIVIAAREVKVGAPKPRAERAPTSTERLQGRGLLVIHEGVNLGLARAWRPEPAEPVKPEPGLPVFPLTDPPRRFDKRGWNGLRPFPTDGFVYADENEEVDARPLCRRVLALKRALDDLDGHARRLARREARFNLASRSIQRGFAPASTGQRLAAYDKKSPQLKGANRILKRASHVRPVRLGHPPGYRRQVTYEVDDILRECHALALDAQRLDSS